MSLGDNRKYSFLCADCIKHTDCLQLGLAQPTHMRFVFCEVQGCGKTIAVDNINMYKVSIPQLTDFEYLLYLETPPPPKNPLTHKYDV